MPKVTIAQQQALFRSIASQIKSARESAGLTQKDLADALDTTQSAISRLESDSNTALGVRVLQACAVALGQELVVTFRSLAHEMHESASLPQTFVGCGDDKGVVTAVMLGTQVSDPTDWNPSPDSGVIEIAPVSSVEGLTSLVTTLEEVGTLRLDQAERLEEKPTHIIMRGDDYAENKETISKLLANDRGHLERVEYAEPIVLKPDGEVLGGGTIAEAVKKHEEELPL